ncbi:MAG: hypothetical protein Kow00124_25290 [Anaerolineae bacterium]
MAVGGGVAVGGTLVAVGGGDMRVAVGRALVAVGGGVVVVAGRAAVALAGRGVAVGPPGIGVAVTITPGLSVGSGWRVGCPGTAVLTA